MVLVPCSVHTGGKGEAQLTKNQAVLLMHDIYSTQSPITNISSFVTTKEKGPLSELESHG